MLAESNYEQVSQRKRAARDDHILRTFKLLSKEGANHNSGAGSIMNEYTSASAMTIVENIRARRWTATVVLEAYILRAIATQHAVNCFTEILFEDALKQADTLDREFESTGRLRGPLHGVPFTAKDTYKTEGVDSTIGITGWADQPADITSEVVQLIREAGGIVFAKTNVPQTLLSFECSNPLWGRTLHPLISPQPSSSRESTSLPADSNVPLKPQEARRFTCGGSSGGEAAILACDGSAIGLGSDIGGSLRIPTAFCGVYAIKLSPGRVSVIGQAAPAPGFEGVIGCLGPMSRTVEDLRIATQVMLGKLHSKVPIPYREDVAIGMKGKKLKFGYYLSDRVAKASPACQRAVRETVDALRRAGHECVLFHPPNVIEAMRIFVALTSADGYKKRLSHLGSDPLEESLFLMTLGPKLPGWLRRFGAWVVERFLDDAIWANIFRSSRIKTMVEYMDEVEARNQYNVMFEREVWKANGFDGIICPVIASPGLPHGSTRTLSPLAVGTILYNIVDSSAGVVPVTRVDPSKDGLSAEWLQGSPLADTITASELLPTQLERDKPTLLDHYDELSSGPHGSKLMEKNLYQSPGGSKPPVYDPELMAGLPIGVQVVGQIHEDEKVLEMMRIVDEALGPRDFGPGSSSRYL